METYADEVELSEKPQLVAGPSGRKQPKSKALLALAGGLAVVAALGTGLWLHYRYRVSTDDAQVDAHIAPVAPKISGNVVEIMVDDNQRVKAGQVLVRIDPRDYQAKVDQAKAALAYAESQAHGAQATVPLTNETNSSETSGAAAQLAAAQAEYERARLTYDKSSSSELAYAQANVDSQRATYERSLADLARMRPLVAKAEISQQQFDSYVAAERVAESQWRAAQQRLASDRQEAESNQAAVHAAQAKVEQARAALAQSRAGHRQVAISAAQASSAGAAVVQAKANLEAAELQLSYTIITAPVDGVVTRKAVQLGQIVQPGQDLLVIVPLDQVWVTANFKETDLADVRDGNEAEVHVDMYGTSFRGHVDSIAGATGARLSLLPPENATGNFVKIVQRIPVKIVLNRLPQGYVLRPGMNVDATILTR